MSATVGEAGTQPAAAATVSKVLGMRKNGTRTGVSSTAKSRKKAFVLTLWYNTGKQWHAPKKAFRPGSGLTSFEKRAKDRVALAAMKAKEKEMKDEKEAERQVRATNKNIFPLRASGARQ